MTEKKLLIGSLSNDLLRVATLVQRGSVQAARRFLQEAKKWSEQLSEYAFKEYIMKIIHEVKTEDKLSMKQAEKYLMYSILLQNYSLKIK